MSDINTDFPVPAFLHTLLLEQYGEADCARIEAGYQAKRAASFRVNPLRATNKEAEETLSALGLSFSRVPWGESAYLLFGAGERELRRTPLYERGGVYFQSLSSMLPPLFLGAKKGEDVLDMTAAPGGKTTEIAALTENGAHITACEKDAVRFARLRYNVERQGARVNLLQTDALRLDDFLRFDKILLDAPCSGSGTFSADGGGAISPKLVENSAILQKKLLKKAAKLLKKGGELVYSTCSVLRKENEEALFALAGTGLMPVPLEPFGGLPLLPSAEGTVCVCPDALYEGFFVAKFKKIS